MSFSELYYGGYGFYGWPYGGVSTAQIPAVDPEKPAKPQEPLERFDTLATSGIMPGFGKAPPPRPLVYWHMRKYSACVLAFAVTAGPIFAGTRTATIRNADENNTTTPKASTGVGVQVMESPEDKRRKLCDDVFEDQWADILGGLECLNFGYHLQEIEWGTVNGVTAPIRFRDFSPFDSVQLDRTKQGDFNGFKYNQQTVDPRYAFHAVCMPQFDRLRGVPRAEFAREPWWRAIQSQDNGDRIERKASGIQMMLEMMQGASWKDADGNPVLNRTMVQTIVDAAASGKTFTVPLMPFTKSDIMAKPELAEMPAVRVKEFDWGQTGPALLAAISRLSRLDVEIMRAWGRPEREAMEGQHGTKAEAGTHGAIGTLDSEQVHSWFLRQFNRQVVDRFLVTNFGPDAAGSIYFKPTPLSDPQQEFKQAVVQALIASPTEGPEATSHLDTRKLLKETEIPLVSEEEAAQAQADAEAKAAEKAKQEAAAKQPVGLNGEGQKMRLALSRNVEATERLARMFSFDEPTLELGYDPNEPRDEDGKWTDGGVEFVSRGNPLPSTVAAKLGKKLSELNSRFPGADPIKRITVLDPDKERAPWGTKSDSDIRLHPGHGDAATVAKRQQEWNGLEVGNGTSEGTIIHEYGHVLAGQLLNKHPKEWKKVWAIVNEPTQFDGGTHPRWKTDTLDGKSEYAREDPSEWVAEAFSDYYQHGSKAAEASRRIGAIYDKVFGKKTQG